MAVDNFHYEQILTSPAPAASVRSGVAEDHPADGGDDRQIVVVGQRNPGAVPGAITPESTFDEQAIAGLGASSLADILAQLAAATGSSQSRAGDGPVLLLNGRRIGSFDEVRNLPPEAIQRVDVLPEEAALRLGYPARSKPVNIVLKKRYAAATGELEDRATTRGLRNDFNTELNLVDIAGDNRTTFDLQYQTGDAITEAKRHVARALDGKAASLAGIVSDPAGGPLTGYAQVPGTGRSAADFAATSPADGTASWRSLVPETQQFTAAGAFARTLQGGKAATVTARYDRLSTLDMLGPAIAGLSISPGADSPFANSVSLRRIVPGETALTRRSITDTWHLGAQLASTGRWQWTLAANFDRVDLARTRRGGVDVSALQTAIDAGALSDPFGASGDALLTPRSASHSVSHDTTLGGDAFLSGSLFALPAGPATLSVSTSASRETLLAQDTLDRRNLGRDRLSGQASLDLPILDRSSVGSVDLEAHLSADHYSDAGNLSGGGAGLVWKPARGLSLLASWASDATVATMAQRGAPQQTTPDVSFYDYATGTSVAATRIDGGDPNLAPDRRSLWKLEFGAKPRADLSLTATYTHISDDNVLIAFPGVSPQIETLLPGRILRDGSGAIASVDARPFNAARETRDELKFLVGFSRSFGKSQGPRVPGKGGFGGGHAFGAYGSMVQLTLSDTMRLSDRLTLTPDSAPIDLVAANSLGEALRVPRHRVEAQLSATHSGVGLRANATWINGGRSGVGLPGEIAFSDRFAFNFRLFWFPAATAQRDGRDSWLKGVRFLLAVDNMFDGYQHATGPGGTTPLAYQRGYLDPIGRTVRFSIRKTLP